MKFILAFLLLSSASAEEKTVCNFIPDDYYKGQAVLIDTDSSGFAGGPTQGDVSIANALTTGSGSSFPSIKAICTLTAANPLDSPPFCTLETTLADGKIMATGTVSSYYLYMVSFPCYILPSLYIISYDYFLMFFSSFLPSFFNDSNLTATRARCHGRYGRVLQGLWYDDYR